MKDEGRSKVGEAIAGVFEALDELKDPVLRQYVLETVLRTERARTKQEKGWLGGASADEKK